jgi:hypothetical protein
MLNCVWQYKPTNLVYEPLLKHQHKTCFGTRQHKTNELKQNSQSAHFSFSIGSNGFGFEPIHACF